VWTWNFGDGTTSNLQNPNHVYNTGGNFQITLITEIPNSVDCIDTISAQTISVLAHSELYIPNTFTPNGDGHNDVFKVRGPYYAEFYFAVYNRWGELMFETADPTVGWDGNFKGKPSDPGVFGYYMKAKCGDQAEEVFRKGNVTLIR
jgi:hypothetical protein